MYALKFIRWKENIVAVLREHGKSVRCSVDPDQKEEYDVLVADEEWIPLQEFLNEWIDDTTHEVLRRNVVTATRNYQQRVQTLMTEIIRHPSNPLSVKHFASKLEFQARGAGHHHGVLWLDIDRIERKVDTRKLQQDIPFDTECDHHFRDPENPELLARLNNLETLLEVGFVVIILISDNNCDIFQTQTQRDLNEEEKHDLENLHNLFPLYGLKDVLKKLKKFEEVTDQELNIIVMFVDSFSTVSLHPAIVGPIVAEIAQKVNNHHHTKTCRKYDTVCRFNFPKLPSYETIIARPLPSDTTPEEKKSIQERHKVVTKKVRKVLEDKEAMAAILEQFPATDEMTPDEAKEGRRNRIDAVLVKAGLTGEEGKQRYLEAISFSPAGYQVVQARDVDELMVSLMHPF